MVLLWSGWCVSRYSVAESRKILIHNFPQRPHTCDIFDVGTAPNQPWNSVPDIPGYPVDKYNHGDFSYLPCQRLSHHTCPGEDNLGPVHDDSSFVDRPTSEIDVFEATLMIIRVPFLSLVGGRRSIRVVNGPTRRKISSFPTWLLWN